MIRKTASSTRRGQTLSTQSIPMSDVSQSSQPSSTEGEINSLSTMSNSKSETETFSSIFPFQTGTSSFSFQGLSLDHTSYTYISASPINTLTTYIITDSLRLHFSSTEDFLGYRSESLFKSSFFNYPSIFKSSKLGLIITTHLLNSTFVTINLKGSSNLNYLPTICCEYSNFVSSTYEDRSSFFKSTDSVIVFESSPSLSESLAQELQSTPVKSLYHTFVSQDETISTLDYTSLTSSTNTNKIKSSIKPSHENRFVSYQSDYINSYSNFVSSDDLNIKSKYVSTNSKIFFNDTLPNKSNVGTTRSESCVNSHSKLGSFETRNIGEFTTFVTSIDKHYLSSNTVVDNSMETLDISESFTMESSPKLMTTFKMSSIKISDITKRIPTIDFSLDMDSSYISYVITKSRQVQDSMETFDISASTPSMNYDTSAILYSYTAISNQDSSNFPAHIFDSTDVYRKRSTIQTSLLTSFDLKTYISASKVVSASFFDDSLRSASYFQSESLLVFSSAMVPTVPQQSSIHHIKMSSLPFTTSGDFVTVTPGIPSLSTKSKVIAISASAAGCVLFVTIIVIILFTLKILPGQKKKQSTKLDTLKEATINSVYGKSLNETSFNWQSGKGFPVRIYNKNSLPWGISNNNYYSSRYNENWDLI